MREVYFYKTKEKNRYHKREINLSATIPDNILKQGGCMGGKNLISRQNNVTITKVIIVKLKFILTNTDHKFSLATFDQGACCLVASN